MKKLTRTVTVLISAIMIIASTFMFQGCVETGSGKKVYEKNYSLDTSKEVELRIVAGKESWTEIDSVIAKFEEIYPNCTIINEYIEKYTDNLPLRLNQEEQKIDIFRTGNIQNNAETGGLIQYAVDLTSEESKKILDISGCNQGLVANYKFIGGEEQYAIPIGGEMRGLYVNVTLLKKFNLSVPTNYDELMNCCKVLLENGYLPFQTPLDAFGQQLLYPYVCNLIVNGSAENYEKVKNIEPGVSEIFRDVVSVFYNIVANNYYDYNRMKTGEDLQFTFANNATKAKEFLNIRQVAESEYEKKDDLGKIAFMTDTQAFEKYISKEKSDYHSAIEYKFIVSPVGKDGGYAYLSPSEGLAVNKNSDNVDWALEFLNFFFSPEINEEFAGISNLIPNTDSALLKYSVPDNRACSVGQVTFEKYNPWNIFKPFFNAGYDEMTGIAKMNNPKYMTDNGDGTYSLKYTLEDYMANLEKAFQDMKATFVEE